VRHDLRNVVAVISGRAELLLSGVNGPLTDAQHRSVSIVVTHADRLVEELDALAALIDQLPIAKDPLP
jgi:signal transduction histidine kinase